MLFNRPRATAAMERAGLDLLLLADPDPIGR